MNIEKLQNNRTKRYWLREYTCDNVDCCDGSPPIQVTHSTDTKVHVCIWCGVQCSFVKTINIIDV